MCRFYFILFSLMIFSSLSATPKTHGEKFNIDCATCHNSESWKVNNDMAKFDHNKTNFPLHGQHKTVSCKKCHQSLVFSEAKTECSECHVDIHQGTVGRDCDRCHTTNSWIVNNIRQIHQQAGFPLVGSHAAADCNRCHTSSSQLRFYNLRTDCYTCHSDKYNGTNHRADGYGTDCATCHKVSSQEWSGTGFDHGFFPLSGGHSNLNCESCHTNGTKKGLNTDCKSCHLDNYNATTNPPHASSNFSTDCKTCHTINAWKPASFNHDSQYFPIYSGKHKGQWSNCNECHTNTANYAQFTCTNCHEHNKSSMDAKHREERSYVYNSVNCYSCHPRGRAD